MSTGPHEIEHNIKITYVESPINQISEEFISEKLQPREAPTFNPDNLRFKQISQRLETNIRKIERIEGKYENKQSMNFKTLKNNLVNGTTDKKKQTKGYFDINPAKLIDNLKNNTKFEGYNPSIRHIQVRRQLQYQNSSKDRIGSRSGNKSLEACLTQIHKLKNTVKTLKNDCIKDSQPDRSSKLASGPLRHNYNSYQSGHKYKNSSGSKYSYTNYRDLSNNKAKLSQDRFIYSERKFNWVKNPKIQEFTIEVGGQQSVE